jgi:hypothetical protein
MREAPLLHWTIACAVHRVTDKAPPPLLRGLHGHTLSGVLRARASHSMAARTRPSYCLHVATCALR